MHNERFSRIEKMIGASGFERLQKCHVAVVGLGAVGSYAVEALARAGIGRLRLVDFDIIRPSNLNRQLYALESTLGRLKIDVSQNRIHDINPACVVEGLKCFVHAETMEEVLAGPPDAIIDAIDSFAPKIELLTASVKRGIPVVSSMGAAHRTDPSLVRLGPLSEIQTCSLARRVRKRLRQRGVDVGFCCVYSAEIPPRFTPVADLQEETPDAEYLERGRERRPLGSLPTLTGIFGLAAANAVLKMMLGGAIGVTESLPQSL